MVLPEEERSEEKHESLRTPTIWDRKPCLGRAKRSAARREGSSSQVLRGVFELSRLHVCQRRVQPEGEIARRAAFRRVGRSRRRWSEREEMENWRSRVSNFHAGLAGRVAFDRQATHYARR